MWVVLALLGLLGSQVGVPGSTESRPDEIPGLVVWLDINTLHETQRTGSKVETWPDRSGHGHDLIDQRDGVSAILEFQQVGGRPAVRIGKANTHRLAGGLSLNDHTIVLVMQTGCSRCGFVQSTVESEEANGILLEGEGNRHFLHLFGRSIPYTDPLPPTDRFGLTVLARRSGVLRAFVDGKDVSTFGEVDGELRCDRFFRLPLTAAVRVDGEGLQLAEVLVYDRYLSPEERRAVSGYLARKFELELNDTKDRRPPIRPENTLATLRAQQGQLLSPTGGSWVEWKVEGALHASLRQGTEDEGRDLVFAVTEQSRLRVELDLIFEPVELAAPISVGLLKNGDDWVLPLQATQRGSDGRDHAVVDATLALDAGESLQVVVYPPEGLETPKIEISHTSRWVLATVRTGR